MLPDRVSNPGPRTYESGALPIALRGPARTRWVVVVQTSLVHWVLLKFLRPRSDHRCKQQKQQSLSNFCRDSFDTCTLVDIGPKYYRIPS